MTKWFEPNEMRYDFYQAEHPWGPWTPSSEGRLLGEVRYAESAKDSAELRFRGTRAG